MVLNGNPYECAGIGEGLGVDVGLVRSPWQDSDAGVGRASALLRRVRPDPIVKAYKPQSYLAMPIDVNTPAPVIVPSDDPACPTDPELTAPQTIDPTAVVGPVGHYFDPDNRTALFVGTSFILPTPQVLKATADTDDPVDALGWHFAHLRFRRVVKRRTPRTEDAAARYVRGKGTGPLTTLESAQTDPVWVQYLPDFSLFPVDGENWRRVDHVQPFLDLKKQTLTLMDRVTQLPTLMRPMASDGDAMFELYAVLTKRVFDLTGRQDQEVYLAVFEQSPDRKTWTTDISLTELGLQDNDCIASD